ncbi:hypothetical protein [Almyronema epifaneia]|uniref:Uncharacterized protein n=1 Tax=Almyronema epifaneia S1 TaxID=2991925 RepID=A0ABW6IE95_9CYAN
MFSQPHPLSDCGLVKHQSQAADSVNCAGWLFTTLERSQFPIHPDKIGVRLANLPQLSTGRGV